MKQLPPCSINSQYAGEKVSHFRDTILAAEIGHNVTLQDLAFAFEAKQMQGLEGSNAVSAYNQCRYFEALK